MGAPKVKVIYVDIESLLDLRQGFLVSMGEKHADVHEYLMSDEYQLREVDDLMGYSKADYDREIEKGNIELMHGSTVTRIIDNINESLDNITHQATAEGTVYVPEIWINLGNFELSEEEISTLKNSVFIQTLSRSVIEVLNMPNEDLTPIFFKENNISFIYIYDSSRWISVHGDSLIPTPLKETEFYFAPMYYKYDTEVLDTIDKLGFGDGFIFMEYVLSHHTKARYLPSFHYSNYLVARGIEKSLREKLESETKDIAKSKDEEIEAFIRDSMDDPEELMETKEIAEELLDDEEVVDGGNSE